jgi:hypothetical protein
VKFQQKPVSEDGAAALGVGLAVMMIRRGD